MAVFTESRSPYEFLIRWDNNGIIQGAHIAFLDTVLKDGEIVTQTQTTVESVAIAEQVGFPLLDVLNQLNIDALKQVEVLQAEKTSLQAEKTALENELQTLKSVKVEK